MAKSNTYNLEINKVHHLDNRTGLSLLPAKCGNLIISDPPYFEVKGEFDFVWKSFDEYLEFIEVQAKLYKRILADNGTLFVWGHKKYIAYIQVIFDKYFNLENSLVWRKIDSMQYQYYSPALARTFNTHNERLLMYSNEVEQNVFSAYLKSEFARAGVANREIAALFPSKTGGMTGCVSNWLNGDNIITEDQYAKIQIFLGNGFLERDYKELLAENEQNRRPFFNQRKLEEILEFSQEGFITKQYDHPTKKPENLTRNLISVCSRAGDLVVVPFAGSGTECAMSAKEGRQFIGFETELKYVEMSNQRVTQLNFEPKLFDVPKVEAEQAGLF